MIMQLNQVIFGMKRNLDCAVCQLSYSNMNIFFIFFFSNKMKRERSIKMTIKNQIPFLVFLFNFFSNKHYFSAKI